MSKVLRVRKATQVHKALKVRKATQVHKAPKAKKVIPVSKGLRVNKDPLVHRVNKALPDIHRVLKLLILTAAIL